MQTKKTLLMAGVGTAIGMATFAGVASAQMPKPVTDENSLVSKIATRFNLNKDDVQKVFDENRESRHVEMGQKMEDRLTQAVTDGKITETQKQAILDKHEEMKTYLESLQDKTRKERNELMKQKMEELRQWAKDNGLSDYVMPVKVRHMIKHVDDIPHNDTIDDSREESNQ